MSRLFLDLSFRENVIPDGFSLTVLCGGDGSFAVDFDMLLVVFDRRQVVDMTCFEWA